MGQLLIHKFQQAVLHCSLTFRLTHKNMRLMRMILLLLPQTMMLFSTFDVQVAAPGVLRCPSAVLCWRGCWAASCWLTACLRHITCEQAHDSILVPWTCG